MKNNKHTIKVTLNNGSIVMRSKKGVKQHLFIDTYREFKGKAKKVEVF